MRLLVAAAFGLVAVSIPSFAPRPVAAEPNLPASAAADGSKCPATAAMESTNGTDYIVAFDAGAPTVANIDIRMFAKSNDYAATLRAVQLTTPYMRDDGATGYRSTARDLYLASGEAILAATVDATIVTGTTCATDDVYVPSVADVQKEARSQNDLDFYTALAKEVGDGTYAIALAVGPPTVFGCATPFTDASTVHTVTPSYSQAAQLEGDRGVSIVRVTLGDADNLVATSIYKTSGSPSLDAAAMVASRLTTYKSATFGCKRVNGSYLFKADFML